MDYTPKSTTATRYCTAILLGLSAAFAAPQSAKAVEISFFAPVPLNVTFCSGLAVCGPLGSEFLGGIAGTIDIADPLSDFNGVAFSSIHEVFVVSAPFAALDLLGLVVASYSAPTALGEVGALTIETYQFGAIVDDVAASGVIVDWSVDNGNWIYEEIGGLPGGFLLASPSAAGPLVAATNFVYVPESSTFLLLSLAGFGAVVVGPARVRRRHRN